MAGKMGKSNPASKRMGNEKRKARRAASWQRGQERKAKNRTEQAAREKANREARAAGLPTPAEQRKAERQAKRAADPAVQERAALFEKDPNEYARDRRARGVKDTPPKKGAQR